MRTPNRNAGTLILGMGIARHSYFTSKPQPALTASRLQQIVSVFRYLKGGKMIRAAISFFILALVAYLFGAYGVAGISVEIGKMLLIVFLALAAISFLASIFTGKGSKLLP